MKPGPHSWRPVMMYWLWNIYLSYFSCFSSFSSFLCRLSQNQQLSLCRLQWVQVLLPPVHLCTRSSIRVSVQVHLSLSDTHAHSTSQTCWLNWQTSYNVCFLRMGFISVGMKPVWLTCLFIAFFAREIFFFWMLNIMANTNFIRTFCMFEITFACLFFWNVFDWISDSVSSV